MGRRSMALLTLVALAAETGFALAQGPFPAPLPGQAASPADGSAPKAIFGGPPPFSSSAGIASSVPSACMNGFAPLREDAAKKGQLIREARDRHAPPGEACKIIGNYSAAEMKLMKYVEANATGCGIPGSVMEQLKVGHKSTEGLLQKVCGIAEQIRARGSVGPSLNDVLDPSTAAPDGRPVISDFGDPAWTRAPRGPVGDFPRWLQ